MATHSATGADTQRSGAVSRAMRRLATETKQAFKTTEFWAMVALVVAILASAALIKGGDNKSHHRPELGRLKRLLGLGREAARGPADDTATLSVGAGGAVCCHEMGLLRLVVCYW